MSIYEYMKIPCAKSFLKLTLFFKPNRVPWFKFLIAKTQTQTELQFHKYGF